MLLSESREKPLPTSPKGKENKLLTFLAAKTQCSKINVQSCWLISFALIVQLRIGATFSKIKHEKPELVRVILFDLKPLRVYSHKALYQIEKRL